MFLGRAMFELGDASWSDLELLGDAPPVHALSAQPPDLSTVSGRQLGGALVLAVAVAQNPFRPFVMLSSVESLPTWSRGFADAR
jgi:hypothetical protein